MHLHPFNGDAPSSFDASIVSSGSDPYQAMDLAPATSVVDVIGMAGYSDGADSDQQAEKVDDVITGMASASSTGPAVGGDVSVGTDDASSSSEEP